MYIRAVPDISGQCMRVHVMHVCSCLGLEHLVLDGCSHLVVCSLSHRRLRHLSLLGCYALMEVQFPVGICRECLLSDWLERYRHSLLPVS